MYRCDSGATVDGLQVHIAVQSLGTLSLCLVRPGASLDCAPSLSWSMKRPSWRRQSGRFSAWPFCSGRKRLKAMSQLLLWELALPKLVSSMHPAGATKQLCDNTKALNWLHLSGRKARDLLVQ